VYELGHVSAKDVYRQLGKKIDSLQVRTPWNDHLYQLLKELYTPQEAEVYCKMPHGLSSLGKISRSTNIERSELERILSNMSAKGLVVDLMIKDQYRYMPSPFVIGIFEFTMMRTGGDTNSKHWAELFHEYLKDDAFYAANYSGGQIISPLRTLPYEESIDDSHFVEVLDYEKATEIINSAKTFAVGICSCRHEKFHLGEKCDAPLEICTTLGSSADYLIRNKLGRQSSKEECLENLDRSVEMGLVLNADNVKNNVSFICHCCKCCCNALAGVSRFGYASAIVTSSFIAKVDETQCNGCGRCVKACPVDTIEMTTVENVRKPVINAKYCLGCGVCSTKCSKKAILLVKRKQQVLHPENTFERIILQTLERGNLQNLIFDNPESFTPKLMKGLVGGFLRLPGVKKALMSDMFRSQFLTMLRSRGKR
jgi:Pyruvate/2-oxoacid:ferredoxin oxidoreductase delta subunit